MAYSSEEEEVIRIVELVCGSISVACCLFICMCYVFLSSLRGYEFRLILYITLSDMLASIMYMLPSSNNDDICSFQGALLCFSEDLRIGCFLHMSIYLHSTLKGTEDKFKVYEKVFILVTLVTCTILASLPFITSSYGNVEWFCWIKVDSDDILSGTIFRFLVSYIPLWSVVFYTNWVYYLMFRKIKSLSRSSLVSKSFAESAKSKLWLYPAILTITWIPALIHRHIEFFDPGFKNLFLICLSQGLITGMGFFNCLVYGFTPEVKHILLRTCLRKNNKALIYESDAGSLN